MTFFFYMFMIILSTICLISIFFPQKKYYWTKMDSKMYWDNKSIMTPVCWNSGSNSIVELQLLCYGSLTVVLVMLGSFDWYEEFFQDFENLVHEYWAVQRCTDLKSQGDIPWDWDSLYDRVQNFPNLRKKFVWSVFFLLLKMVVLMFFMGVIIHYMNKIMPKRFWYFLQYKKEKDQNYLMIFFGLYMCFLYSLIYFLYVGVLQGNFAMMGETSWIFIILWSLMYLEYWGFKK